MNDEVRITNGDLLDLSKEKLYEQLEKASTIEEQKKVQEEIERMVRTESMAFKQDLDYSKFEAEKEERRAQKEEEQKRIEAQQKKEKKEKAWDIGLKIAGLAVTIGTTVASILVVDRNAKFLQWQERENWISSKATRDATSDSDKFATGKLR